MGGEAAAADTRTTISITKEQKLFLAGQPVELDALAAALIKLKQEQPGVKLELEADSDSALGVLVRVWDALREAGFSVNEVPARIERAES